MMTSTADNAASLKARERGNALYKNGDLVQAESAYIEAARLAPEDSSALSNLSAVKFEVGNLTGCILFCQKALKLLDAHPPIDAERARQKLYLRLARAFLYALKLDEARDALSKVTSEDVRGSLEASLSQAIHLRNSRPDQYILWRRMLDRLPRYRPSLLDEPEYFSVGHDDAETVLHPSLLANSSDVKIACLFCGIGDARNLFATLAYIGISSVSIPSLSGKQFHFTLVDIKPAVFARDLLFFRLLFDLEEESGTKQEETLATLSYIFCAQVMPQWAYDRFQVALSALLEILRKQDGVVMDIFYVRHDVRTQVIRHIDAWQRKPEPWYSTKKLREIAKAQTEQSRIKDQPYQDDGSTSPPGCGPASPDAIGFAQFTVMMPHTYLLEQHEPILLKHLTAFGKTRSRAAFRKIDEYLDSKWQPNVSLVDLDFENQRQEKHIPLMDFEPHKVACVLFSNIPTTIAGETTGVLNHLCGFFKFVETWATRIRSQLTIEIVLGEMADTFERIHRGVLRRDWVKMGRLDPATFPDAYDAIHMSNIPDYIGGPLTTFLGGAPIHRHVGISEMQSNVLRNTRRWITHDQFLAEHLLLESREKIQDHFGMMLSENSAKIEESLSGMIIHNGGCVMAMNLSWKRHSHAKLPWRKMMSRSELERWLIAHFLKLSLPFPRPVWEEQLVFAPLNMTVFFRLVCHAFERGYPAHWLSDLMSRLCEGEIVTTARPPRAVVTDVELAKKVYQPRKICIKPFVAEFKVLLSLWRALLPFGLCLSHETLPNPGSIREYRLAFPLDSLQRAVNTAVPHFALVLKHRDLEVMGDLREILLDDERGDSSKPAVRARAEPAAHVISTFKWKTETATATFWFEQALMDYVCTQGGWEAYVWRSDTWLPALGPIALEQDGFVSTGNAWQ